MLVPLAVMLALLWHSCVRRGWVRRCIAVAWGLQFAATAMQMHVEFYQRTTETSEAREQRLGATLWALPIHDALVVVLPRIVYALCGIQLLACLSFPGRLIQTTNSGSLESQLHALALVVVGSQVFPSMTLLGASQVTPAASCLIQLPLLLTAVHSSRGQREKERRASSTVVLGGLSELSVGAMVVLVGFAMFFTTGHRMTFNAVPVSAAFVGLLKFDINLSPMLVFLHTYCSFILAFCALPAAVVVTTTAKGGSGDRNAAPPVLLVRLVRVMASVLVAASLRYVASEVALIILRRHLMVWSVFAPKYLYDGMAMLLLHGLAPLLAIAAHRLLSGGGDSARTRHADVCKAA